MTYAREMLDSYLPAVKVDPDTLATSIDALKDCAQTCAADVDADLGEPDVTEMVKCIRLCLDCADICTATVRITGRLGEYEAAVTRPLLEACVAVCAACGDECEQHAFHHEHCRVCASACRQCEQACQRLLAALR